MWQIKMYIVLHKCDMFSFQKGLFKNLITHLKGGGVSCGSEKGIFFIQFIIGKLTKNGVRMGGGHKAPKIE